MKLTIKERLVFPGLYPRETDTITGMIFKGINEKIEITTQDREQTNFRRVENGWQWDEGKPKDIEFSDIEINLLKENAERLDKSKKIPIIVGDSPDYTMLGLVSKIRDYQKKDAK